MRFQCRVADSIPGGGTKIPRAMWYGKKKKSIARNNILCLSIANAFIDPSLSSILSLFLSKGMLDFDG